jgi:hypothetical protein
MSILPFHYRAVAQQKLRYCHLPPAAKTITSNAIGELRTSNDVDLDILTAVGSEMLRKSECPKECSALFLFRGLRQEVVETLRRETCSERAFHRGSTYWCA